jgi:hypothetical protein
MNVRAWLERFTKLWFWISCVLNSLLLMALLWYSRLATPLFRRILIALLIYVVVLAVAGIRAGLQGRHVEPHPGLRAYRSVLLLVRKSGSLISLLLLTVGAWGALLRGDVGSVWAALWFAALLFWTVGVVVLQLRNLARLLKRKLQAHRQKRKTKPADR